MTVVWLLGFDPPDSADGSQTDTGCAIDRPSDATDMERWLETGEEAPVTGAEA